MVRELVWDSRTGATTQKKAVQLSYFLTSNLRIEGQPREAHFSPRLKKSPSDRWAWQHQQEGLIKTLSPTNNNKLGEGHSIPAFPTERHCSSQEVSIRDALPQQVLIPGSSLHFHRQGEHCKNKGSAREASLSLKTWNFHTERHRATGLGKALPPSELTQAESSGSTHYTR